MIDATAGLKWFSQFKGAISAGDRWRENDEAHLDRGVGFALKTVSLDATGRSPAAGKSQGGRGEGDGVKNG